MNVLEPLVFDDVLDQDHADMIEKTLTSENFPWGIQKHTVSFDKITEGHRDIPYMSHLFMDHGSVMSPYVHIPTSIMQTFMEKTGRKYTDIYRIMANLTHPVCGTRMPTPIHIDNRNPHHVMIYYPIDSDGDTIIYTDQTGQEILTSVSPRKNRILLFDGSYYHCAMPTGEHDMRMVINYNMCPPTHL